MQNQFFDEIISKIQNITGVDVIYFLNKNCQIIKEHKITGTNNYTEEIIEVIKSESLLERVSKTFNSNLFHTYILLNEYGLIIISNLSNVDTIYMIIVAGENEPVDLIKLLKICKETRSCALLQTAE